MNTEITLVCQIHPHRPLATLLEKDSIEGTAIRYVQPCPDCIDAAMSVAQRERNLIRVYLQARVCLATMGVKRQFLPLYLTYSLSLADLTSNFTAQTLVDSCQD